jgi:membrane-bound serine protease (ClpP class)
MRRYACAFTVAIAATRLAGSALAPPAASGHSVLAAEFDGIIHPVSAEFFIQTIDRADASGAELVVLTLRTPGGLVDSTNKIVSRIISAKTPVVVFIAPGGARAASAGFLITMAADVAAMAPGTHIGAAHPVSGGGEKLNETMSKKAASDVAAAARTVAARRGRNVELVEKAVTESRAFTEDEALKATPPLIDLVAVDLHDLLRKLDGRTVVRFDGSKKIVRTSGARVDNVQMSRRQRFLSGIAHPQVAYLLFSLGTLGLTIELWSPGAILPGVVGGVCLLLAFFAFQILPVNYAGLLLILFGLLLLALEIKVTSFGLLAAGGLASLILGSMILMDSPLPELQVGLRLIIPMTVAMAGIVLFLARLAYTSQLRRAMTGTAGMIDATGQALTDMSAGGRGTVRTRGEIWSAVAVEPITSGEIVQITAVDGLTLRVKKART